MIVKKGVPLETRSYARQRQTSGIPLDKISPDELEEGIFPTAAERTEAKCSKTSGMSLGLRLAIQTKEGTLILYVWPVSQKTSLVSIFFWVESRGRPPGALKCPERPAGSLSPVSVAFSD